MIFFRSLHEKDSHNPKTLIKSGNMPKVLTSLLTNAIIGYRFAQNGKNVSEKPYDKRFFEVHFCLQLQPTRPVGDETYTPGTDVLMNTVATHTPRRGRNIYSKLIIRRSIVATHTPRRGRNFQIVSFYLWRKSCNPHAP